jgi:drug/metabolite transporter (DMT)-like permease
MFSIIIFIILCLIWGSTWLAIKIGLENSPPFIGAGFRFAIAAAFLYLLCFLSGRWNFGFLKQWRAILIIAIVLYALPYGLVYWGSQYVESGMAAVLFATMPFFVAILAHVIIKDERLILSKIAGMILGFGGIMLIFADNLGTKGRLGLLGMLGIVISSFFSGLGTILTKKFFRDISPMPLTAIQTTISAILLLILGLITESFSVYHGDVKTIGSLLYLGIIGTAVAFSLYLFLLKTMEATKLSLIAFLTPIVALFLGVIFYNENFDLASLLGSLMVITGVLIAAFSRMRGSTNKD